MYEEWSREIDLQIFTIMLRLKGFTYTELINMIDLDREWWYEQVIDYNKREEEHIKAQSRGRR